LDYPYWISDGGEIADHVNYQKAGMDWNSCLARTGELLEHALDANSLTWQLAVFFGVTGVPSLGRSATVVLLQVSHALMVGPSMADVGECFFGSTEIPLTIPGMPSVVEQYSPLAAALRGLLRMPIKLGSFAAGRIEESRRTRRGAPTVAVSPPPPVVSLIFNQNPGRSRSIRTFTLDLNGLRAPGFTVSALGLTAISKAMQLFLRETDSLCPDELSCAVTVALGAEAEMMGVNRIGVAYTPLHLDIENLSDRAQEIVKSLKSGVESAKGPDVLRSLSINSKVPFPYYRLLSRFENRTADSPPAANTMLTSIRCRESDAWNLSGRKLAAAGMVPALSSNIGIAHSFVGVGQLLTVSVLSSPTLLPDIDRYVEILRRSFDLVLADVQSRGSTH
jgi:diacylglycerol O-acyltransferase / wax synthase